MRWWRSFWRWLGRFGWFTPFARAVVPLDRAISRLTRGRIVALGMTPSLLITTTGRRSGLPRQNPLAYVRDGADFVVIGSNWGQDRPPGWVFNLLASPVAIVTVRGADIAVRAAEVTAEEEHRRLWQLIVSSWPGYRNYLQTAGDRPLRIFRLIPAG